ncbi:DUF6069 family protein [Amycolatopsis sp. NPDC004747]
MNNPDVENRPAVNAGRLWAGGAASAIVAVLVTVVGILTARGIVHVPILAPKGEGTWGGANTLTYTLGAAALALAATGLLHLLLVTTPRALVFFGWIMVLVTAIGVVMPLSLATGLDARLTTALLNLVIGLSLVFTLSSVARSAAPRPLDT